MAFHFINKLQNYNNEVELWKTNRKELVDCSNLPSRLEEHFFIFLFILELADTVTFMFSSLILSIPFKNKTTN